MSMHTYARTLTPIVQRPQRIDDAIDRARMPLAYTHRVPPNFEARSSTLRPNYINEKWGISSHEGHTCPTNSNLNSSHVAQAHLVPTPTSRPMTILRPYVPMKHSLPHQSTLEPITHVMRESRKEHVYEYITTTPKYDKHGHKIFLTYYLQDSKGLLPMNRVTAIGRGQPQALMR